MALWFSYLGISEMIRCVVIGDFKVLEVPRWHWHLRFHGPWDVS